MDMYIILDKRDVIDSYGHEFTLELNVTKEIHEGSNVIKATVPLTHHCILVKKTMRGGIFYKTYRDVNYAISNFIRIYHVNFLYNVMMKYYEPIKDEPNIHLEGYGLYQSISHVEDIVRERRGNYSDPHKAFNDIFLKYIYDLNAFKEFLKENKLPIDITQTGLTNYLTRNCFFFDSSTLTKNHDTYYFFNA
jgi:hypothetical protein